MMNITPKFYVWKNSDGLYHIQNYIGMYKGQHHIHNEDSYKQWMENLNKIERSNMVMMRGTCECGHNKSGIIEEYDGRVWFNNKFESERK